MEKDLGGEYRDLGTVTAVRKLVFDGKRSAHAVLGGGKVADIVLWKNKIVSITVLFWVTSIWILVEWGGFNALPLACNSLSLASLMLNFHSELKFIISRLHDCFIQTDDNSCIGRLYDSFKQTDYSFVRRFMSCSQVPTLTEGNALHDLAMHINQVMRHGIEEVSRAFQCTGLERNFFHFIVVNAVLYMVSTIGSLFDFVTLLYIAFLILYVSLAFYGRYEDDVDSAIAKILFNIHRHYLVLNATILRMLRRFRFMKMKLC